MSETCYKLGSHGEALSLTQSTKWAIEIQGQNIAPDKLLPFTGAVMKLEITAGISFAIYDMH